MTHRLGENSLKCISDKVILSKTYKELLNSIIRKQFNF